MDLAFNPSPRFTEWLVKSGTLHERFVVVDVGVQGGENPRWHAFGDHLVVHGFDAIEEAIVELRKTNSKPNRHYHSFAIGNQDGERSFFFKPSNPTNSSFYDAPNPSVETRNVPMRRLDTLLNGGVIPKADFLKVDVEGFERDVLLGAANLLSGVLGVESESNFNTSEIYPGTHFGFVQAAVLKHGLLVADLNFNRILRPAYQQARSRRGLPELAVDSAGRPATLNVLFCRDLTAERRDMFQYQNGPRPSPLTIDQILKLIAIYELHGLNDIAVDTAAMLATELGQRVDVERTIDLLTQDAPPPSMIGALQASVARRRRSLPGALRSFLSFFK